MPDLAEYRYPFKSMSGAKERAIDYLERAVELLEQSQADKADLYIRLADGLLRWYEAEDRMLPS